MKAAAQNTRWVDRLDRHGGAVTRRIALIAVLGMLFISGLTALDVVMRAVFNAAIFGFLEVIEVAFAVTIAATFPSGLTQRNQVTIDIFEDALGRRGDVYYRVFAAIALLGYFAILAWRFTLYAADAGSSGDHSMLMRIPLGPIWWSVSLLLGACVVVQSIVLMVSLADAIGYRKPAQADGKAEWSVASTVGIFALLATVVVFIWPFFSGPSLVTSVFGSKATVALVVFTGMCVLALYQVPLGAAMGLAGLAGAAIVLGPRPALSSLANEGTELMASLNLAIIPLFLMMGSFAAAAGLAGDVYKLAHAFLGHRAGGLAMATIGGCAGFGAVTGSSIATVATIGRVAYPEMQQRGYSAKLSTGTIAAGGTLGTLIPPSGTIILYAILSEVSIGDMFAAALVPALIAVLFYFAVIKLQVWYDPTLAPSGPRETTSERWKAFLGAWPVYLLFGVVFGGLYAGFFTVSEAAAIGAGSAFLLAWGRGKLKDGAIWRVFGETAATTSMLFILILGGMTFSFFIGLTQLPEVTTAYLETLNLPPYAVIAALLILFVVLGTALDPHGILVITVPIVTPLIAALGYDLVWWGILMVVVVEIGVLSPPVGMNIFVMKGVAPDVSVNTVFRGIMPFLTADIVRLLLLALVPSLVLFLPHALK